MAIRLFSDLLPRVLPSVDGCPTPTVIAAIRDAAIQTCIRTLAWQSQLVAVPAVVGQAEYDYLVPPDCEVQALLEATYDGKLLRVMRAQQLRARDDKWPTPAAAQGVPMFIAPTTTRKFAVLPAPDVAGSIELRAVLKPLRTAIGMEDEPFNELEDAFVHGALQYLLVAKDKFWSDRELASYHAKQFLAQLMEHRARVNLTAGMMLVQVQPVPFV